MKLSAGSSDAVYGNPPKPALPRSGSRARWSSSAYARVPGSAENLPGAQYRACPRASSIPIRASRHISPAKHAQAIVPSSRTRSRAVFPPSPSSSGQKRLRFVNEVEEFVRVGTVHRHEASKRRAELFQVIRANPVRRFKIAADSLLHKERNAVVERIDDIALFVAIQSKVVIEKPDLQGTPAYTPIARPPIWRARYVA